MLIKASGPLFNGEKMAYVTGILKLFYTSNFPLTQWKKSTYKNYTEK